jgi:hypothetical protein
METAPLVTPISSSLLLPFFSPSSLQRTLGWRDGEVRSSFKITKGLEGVTMELPKKGVLSAGGCMECGEEAFYPEPS